MAGTLIPSVTFSTKNGNVYNTYSRWNLAPTGNVNIALPKQKVQTVDVPGRDGVIDISNSLKIGGGPLFDNREGSFEFVFLDPDATWQIRNALDEIVRVVHGQFLYVQTSFDNKRYYGRCEVESYTDPPDGSSAKIKINYSLEP